MLSLKPQISRSAYSVLSLQEHVIVVSNFVYNNFSTICYSVQFFQLN